jgi:hypothetical protein
MKNNPYVGPRPYENNAEDRVRFFGRERETLELTSLILSEREVLVYAQSGAGKTSLFNAAIIPTLQEEHNYQVLPVARVGNSLPASLEPANVDNLYVFSTLLSLAGASADPQYLIGHTLFSYLKERLTPDLASLPAEVRRNRQLPLLVFDQFEEIFTTHRSRWQDAQGFFDQVREVVDELPRLGVVFSMREEYVAMLDPFLNCFFHRLRTRFRLEPLKRGGALEAIMRPAADAGHPFGNTVAGDLVDNLRRINVQTVSAPFTIPTILAGQPPASAGESEHPLGQFIEPVQLQVVCSSLWESLPDERQGMITTEDIEQYGNVDMALENFYNRAVQTAVSSGADTGVRERDVREWFEEKLITSAGTRGSVFEETDHTGGLINKAVAELDHLHIIRAEIRAGGRWYELSHDRMVDPVLESNRKWKAARETPFRVAARRWDEDRDNLSLLYNGKALDEAQDWAAAQKDDVEEFELDFLDASQNQENAALARQRRLVFTAIGAIVVFFVMLGLTIWSLNNRQEAVHQKSVAVTAQSEAVTQAGVAQTAQNVAVTQAAIAETAQNIAVTQAAIAKTESAHAEEQAVLADERAQAAEVERMHALSAQSFAEYERVLTRAQNPEVSVDEKMALEAIAPKYLDQSKQYEKEAKRLQEAFDEWRSEHGIQAAAPDTLFTFEILRASYGSSFLVHYGPPGAPRQILIDGGPGTSYREVLRPRLVELSKRWNVPLRLVIATQTDEEGIGGLIELVEDLLDSRAQGRPDTIKIEGVWSNAFLPGSPEEAQALVAEYPKVRLVAGAKMLNIPVNKPFTQMIAAPEAGSARVSLDEQLTITVLSPRVQWLRTFAEDWLRTLRFHAKDATPEYLATLDHYDIIETFADPRIELLPSPIEIVNPANTAGKDKSVVNQASTILMLELAGKRILITADARSDVILSALAQAGYTDDQGNMDIDLLVLPHSGSEKNVSEEFFQRVKARYYIITGNGRYGRPDLATFEKLFAARRADLQPFSIALTYLPEEYIENYPVAEFCALLAQERSAGIPFEIITPKQGENSFGIDLWSQEIFVNKGDRNAVCGLDR